MRYRAALVALAVTGALLGVAGPASADYHVTGAFGGAGTGRGEFGPPRADFRTFRLLTSPGGIAFAGNTVLVADPLNARIQRFTTSGRFLGAFGHKGVRPGEFLSPQGLVVHAGKVFVAMNGNDRVDVFSLRGRWQRMFQVHSNVRKTFAMSRGGGRGQLHNPYQIVRAPNGRFYVADLTNGRVNIYTGRGFSRGQLGVFGPGSGQFLAPYGVTADGAGNVYVADRDLNRISKFSSGGQLLAEWGETGTQGGEFLSPQGLAVDRAGNLYVADTNNARVQKFAPDGTFLASFGQGVLKQPLYVAVDKSCTVWVSDYRRVVKFADGGC
jgi:DNA-binding beta-propeller fold protein YncE